jgi:hypothetical protein
VETRAAILGFTYSEKMKSGLIIGTRLLDQFKSLREEERPGGKKVLVWFLEGLFQEAHSAETILGIDLFIDLKRKVVDLIGSLENSRFEEAQGFFSDALSLVTTSCQRSMSSLVEKRLI